MQQVQFVVSVAPHRVSVCLIIIEESNKKYVCGLKQRRNIKLCRAGTREALAWAWFDQKGVC